jgi:alpha-glucosidase
MKICRLNSLVCKIIGCLLVSLSSVANAQINYSAVLSGGTLIYSNAFNGTAVNISNTPPNFAATLLGGSNNAVWIDALGGVDTNAFYANGKVGTGQGDSILLPFKPQSGCVYTLTASMTFTGNPQNWIGAGFAQSYASPGGSSARFADSSINGYDFSILTESTGNVQFFAGPRGTVQLISQNGFFPAGPGTHTFSEILDTTSAQWVIASFVDGVQASTNYTYAGNPTIAAIGITQNSLTGGGQSNVRWNSFTLSASQLVILQQPASGAVNAGDAFTNTVVVGGASPFFYQWYTNGAPIGDATNASLIINPVSADNASDDYYVVVTNSAYGAITSAPASLIVVTNATTNIVSQLTSPDGNLVLTFATSNFDGSASCPVYSLTGNGQTLVTTSKLGLTFNNGGLLQDYLAVLGETYSTNSGAWQPVYGEKSCISNNYNQLVVNLQEIIPPYRQLQLTFRAYNEGLAFSYTIPSQTGFAGATNLTEQTEFRFDADYPTWATYTAQGVYSATTISGVTSGCERPLPVELQTNLYVALGEAGLVDYSRMKFAPLSGKSDSLVSLLDGPVTNSLPLTTPWRFIMVADSPGKLVENDSLVLNLNEPCTLTNTSWIKPGKAIREVTLTTKGALACIDFAAKHHLQYIEFDAGWYGPETTTLVATNVVGSLNMPQIISYGASRNVGVILYVNWLAMTNELTLLPPLYSSWGIKGIKYGFVSVGPQQYTEIVNSAAPICASNQMMFEVHDEFRPSGYTRTYPNFMTVEGIAGDETTPTATQDTTSLFSRMLVGGADHTMCYFDSRVTNWSNAYQLAKAVCFYSPYQYLYWYDRPTNSSGYVSGGNDMITEVPEMEFYDYLPTVWDETRVLQGSIGQYAITARCTGTQWFIGAMNANSTRTFNVPLNFLTRAQKYVANIYSQDPSVPTRTHVRIDRVVVDSTATLTMTLGASSGEAIRLVPANPPAIQSVSLLPGNGLGLSITGLVSQPYSLWASSGLASSGISWTLLNNGLITNNPSQWNDTLTQTQRFYRCSTP